MDTTTIIRAWKDPDFRSRLSSEQRAALPECPAGTSLTELDESDLDGAVGGGFPGFTRVNKACIPVVIKPRPWETVCALSRDPTVDLDPLSPVVNPALDLQLALAK
jgi:mersacidin/lichenicidin family type 2 lantibiotic